jgi:tetratricopeptide (TPR) repeat protein
LGVGKKMKWLVKGGKVVRLNKRATAAFEVGDTKEALKLLLRAVKAYPHYEVTYHNLGNVYLALDKVQEAEDVFRKAIELKPTFVEALNDLASLLVVRRGRKDEAEKLYRRAIEVNPKYPYSHVNLGNLLMGKGQFTEAEIEFKKALESKGLDPETRKYLEDTMAI